MELTKSEILAALDNVTGTTAVRFSLGGEELEIIDISFDAGVDDTWITLKPKGEEDEPYFGKHRAPNHGRPEPENWDLPGL